MALDELKIHQKINSKKTRKNRFVKMLDSWQQSSLPALSEIPDLGQNTIKKYCTQSASFACLAQTYHGPSVWDTLKVVRNLPAGRGYCSIQCAAQLGLDLIPTLKEFHDMGYVHLDIKPDNVLVGAHNSGQICLIDYGISESYIDKDKKHRKSTFRNNIFGNQVYMSKNALDFHCQSRRDDLIGMMYMLISLVNGSLPWHNFQKMSQLELKEMKNDMTSYEIASGAASEFGPILEHIYTYGYETEPDYNKVKFMFEKILLDQNKVPSRQNFEWVKKTTNSQVLYN